MFDLQLWMIQPIGWALAMSLPIGLNISILERFFGGEKHRQLMNSTPSFKSTIQGLSWWTILQLIVLGLVFLEEMIFRLPICWIANGQFSLIVWLAILISGTIFGFLHMDKHKKTLSRPVWRMLWLISGIIVGIVFGWLTVATDSILPPLIVHFCNNVISLIESKIAFRF